MIKPATHEISRLRIRIAGLEKQLEHDAWVKSTLADQLAATRAELDDAVRLGTQYATIGRALSMGSLVRLTD